MSDLLQKAFFAAAILFLIAVAGLMFLRGRLAQPEKPGSPLASPGDEEGSDLVGQPAALIRADVIQGGSATSLADLKGKVVLLDFWTVWCGPCIRSFPHLQALQEEHGAAGLQVVGVTTYFGGYDFDQTKGRIIRAQEELGPEAERRMLGAFAAHHRLDYPIWVVPWERFGQVKTAYRHQGWPQMVLIDRQGTVRMVKVGASPANFAALENKIRELLAEK